MIDSSRSQSLNVCPPPAPPSHLVGPLANSAGGAHLLGLTSPIPCWTSPPDGVTVAPGLGLISRPLKATMSTEFWGGEEGGGEERSEEEGGEERVLVMLFLIDEERSEMSQRYCLCAALLAHSLSLPYSGFFLPFSFSHSLSLSFSPVLPPLEHILERVPTLPLRPLLLLCHDRGRG